MVPTVYIDYRERRCGMEKCLKKKNLNPVVVNGQITDYVLDWQCGVERKTVNDFLSSIVDKRIFNQALTLKNNFIKPLILLEGGRLYTTRKSINPNVIRGTLLWLSNVLSIPVIRTYSTMDSAEFISLLASRRAWRNSTQIKYGSSTNKPPVKKINPQVSMLESIGGVGRNLACNLIKEFGSIKNIALADENELSQIKGLGKQKAKDIIKSLR